ncbi:MAG: stage III sporulation AC/AD family protein [Clostridia bacterium]|nr:stage III sporulation AC/AD family protein [Clostridia bacterium]
MTAYAEVLRICGGAVIAWICLHILRTYDRSSGVGVAAGVFFSVLLACAAVSTVMPVLSFLKAYTEPFLSSEYSMLLFRALALGLTVQICADVIRDAGEGGLANRLEMVGRGALLCMGLPLYEDILALALRLIG